MGGCQYRDLLLANERCHLTNPGGADHSGSRPRRCGSARPTTACARNVLCVALELGTLASSVAEHLRARHLTLAALTAVRIITGVAVFAFSVLAEGIAAWLMLLRELWWRMMIAAASKLP